MVDIGRTGVLGSLETMSGSQSIAWTEEALAAGAQSGDQLVLDEAAELLYAFSDGCVTAHTLPWSKSHAIGASSCEAP